MRIGHEKPSIVGGDDCEHHESRHGSFAGAWLEEHRHVPEFERYTSSLLIPLTNVTALTYIDGEGKWHRVSKDAPEQSSVLSLEDSALDIDQVDNLIKFCPTKEEMEVLKGYKGEKDNLGKCEQFFLELMQVPRIEHKLRVYSFKIQFRSQVSDLGNSLNVVNSVSDQIRGSAKLKRIMQTILSLGNALNQGTARGIPLGLLQ